MKKFRTELLALAVLLAPLFLVAPAWPLDPAHTPPSRAVQPLTATQLRNDIRFRESFGLRADPSYVRQLYRDVESGAADASPAAGALLTPAEQADVVGRGSGSDVVIDAADDYFATQPSDLFAGLYIDQLRDGLVVIGVTEDPARHQVALRSLIGRPASFEVVPMDHSLDALYALHGAVDAAVDDLLARGVDVSSVGVDEEANLVLVGVASDRTAATQVLRERFGDGPIRVDDMPHRS